MTHRELIQKAIQFSSLSRKEWDSVVDLQEKVSGNLFTALQALLKNQAQIELLSDYLDYYSDRLESPVSDKKITDIRI